LPLLLDSPDSSVNDPELPDRDDLPADNTNAPESPVSAVPEDSVNEPELPLLFESPEDNTNRPLLPLLLDSPDSSVNEPELPDRDDLPADNTNAPEFPVLAVPADSVNDPEFPFMLDLPAVKTKFPESPLVVVCPDVIVIDPESDDGWLVFPVPIINSPLCPFEAPFPDTRPLLKVRWPDTPSVLLDPAFAVFTTILPLVVLSPSSAMSDMNPPVFTEFFPVDNFI